MNFGRIDVTTVSLAATQWIFALPRHLHWSTVRASPPCLTEPEGRYFIHCLQHWIIRFPRQYAHRFRKFTPCELDQETILVDNHGQVYVVFAHVGLHNDMGVHYFTIAADASYTPLTLSQIEAVKAVSLPPAPEGEEGLPSWCREETAVRTAITEAIASAAPLAPVEPDPLTEQGIFEEVGRHVMNPAALEEPEVEKRRYLYPSTLTDLKQAYINIQHSKNPAEKEDGRLLLASYLKDAMPKQFHRRIDTLNRTMLARKLAKYYIIEFPKSTDKELPLLPTDMSAYFTHAEYGYLYH